MDNENSNSDVKAINHITFAVKDLEASMNFYEILLNGKLVAKSDKLVYFDVNGLWLALNLEDHNKERVKTYSHIAFSMTKENQDKLKDKLRLNHIEYEEGRLRSEREGHSLYVRDLDNHLIEFHSLSLRDRLSYYANERDDIQIFK